MQIGNYKIHMVETGRFGLDGGAMFGVVPKVLWNRSNPADDANRIELAMRTLLLVSDTQKILFDTGIGDYWPEKFQQMYAVNHSRFSTANSLQDLGYQPDDITDVILTHLHFDHVGGAVCKSGDEYLPYFKNAKYYIQKEHFEYAQNSGEKDRASFIPETFMPLHAHNRLELLEGPGEIFPGIEVLKIYGHTVAQQMIKISDATQTLLYCGDLIPTTSHIPLPYVMAYDIAPMTTIEEKKHYLPQAVAGKWVVFFEHDPFFATATIKETPKGFAAEQKFENLPQ